MEESKELQGFYKIFRAVIYISVLMEFFEYAIDQDLENKKKWNYRIEKQLKTMQIC